MPGEPSLGYYLTRIIFHFYTVIRGKSKFLLLTFACTVFLNIEGGAEKHANSVSLPSIPGFWSLVVLINRMGK